ncbi:MAG: NaeI family type II restriction endonuclease [Terracidiphilus sp.]
MAKNRSGNLEKVPAHQQQGDPDSLLIEQLEKAILRNAGGHEKFKKEIPILLRKAIDEVIDSARTNRFTLDEIEKTEKTYLGTKVEILLRNWLGFPQGEILDLSIDGIETDIKNTMRSTWMIPSEAMGHPCILVKTDEQSARFSIGIIMIRDDVLSTGKNKDGKSSISLAGRDKIHWILQDELYPENFWQNLSQDLRIKITSPNSGTKRLDALFRYVQKRPISRTLLLGLGQQDDAMKRLRKNGGARDSLARDGIALLSGNYDSALIEALKLPRCEKGEFISFTPIIQSDISILRKAGHIK